jgi:Snf7
MMKAGLIEEMMDDTMDTANDLEEEEVDGEVEKVLQEVAGEQLAKLPNAGRTAVAAEKLKTEEVCIQGACLSCPVGSGFVMQVCRYYGRRFAFHMHAQNCVRLVKSGAWM